MRSKLGRTLGEDNSYTEVSKIMSSAIFPTPTSFTMLVFMQVRLIKNVYCLVTHKTIFLQDNYNTRVKDLSMASFWIFKKTFIFLKVGNVLKNAVVFPPL